MEFPCGIVGLSCAMLVVASGCATTKKVPVEKSPAACTFLGEDICNRLTVGEKGQPGLRWVDPSAQLTQYNKVIVEVIGFYGVDPQKVKPEEQQALTAYFQQAVTEQLARKFTVTTEPGEGVLRIQFAVLDADAATPGARSLSVVPPVQFVGRFASLATGKFPFAGGAQTVGKATDSVTGRILGAAVAERIGAPAPKTAAVWEWGDAQNAIDDWAKLLTEGLFAYTSGAKKP